MQIQINKNILIFISLIALVSSVFSYQPLASKAVNFTADNFMRNSKTTVQAVKVIQANNEAAVTAAAPQPLASTCSISFNEMSQIQNTADFNLFTKPASCFSINLAKAAVFRPLAVQDKPQVFPTIVVRRIQDTIQNNFQDLPLAQGQSSAALPLTVSLILIVAFANLGALNKLRGRLSLRQNFFISGNFSFLEIMRC